VPLFPPDETALYAGQLADACGSAGQLVDEAPLIQLLKRCSAALAADVATLAAPPEPAAATAAVAADATAKGAAHAKTDIAASVSSRPARAAAPQCSITSAQQRATQVGASKRDMPAGEQTQPSQPPACDQEPGPEWESEWAAAVTTALRVRPNSQYLIPCLALEFAGMIAGAD
jgi:hypothetical protein